MESYKDISQAILNEIRQLGVLAQERTSKGLLTHLDMAREKLRSDNFHIVVMGQFKRGKTTFINSLLGEQILPSSVVPLTSINTILRYGGQLKAEVHYCNDRVEEIGVDEIARFVTEKENPENCLNVKRVDIFHPSSYLKEGLCLVDTPWTGSTYLHNDEMAHSYLAHADAVVFMISADPPISKVELDFLEEIKEYVRKIFFVQNKIDYLNDSEREESLHFNRSVLVDVLGEDSVEIFPLSAKKALKARQTDDAELLDESRLSSFLARLDEFLLKEKGLLLLESILKNLHKVVTEEIAAIELEESLLTGPLGELEEKIKQFEEQMVLIKRERDEILYLIDGDFNALVKDVLDEHIEEFKNQMAEPLLQRYNTFFDDNRDLSGFALAEKLNEFIKEVIRESFTSWRQKEEKHLSESLK